MVPDIHAKFHNQQFIMRRAIKLYLTLFVQNDLKWRTFSITLAKLEPQWPHSEQRSDVIHGSGHIIIVAPSDDHYGIDIVVPSSDHCCTVAVPPSCDHYCITKVASPSDHLHTKRTYERN